MNKLLFLLGSLFIYMDNIECGVQHFVNDENLLSRSKRQLPLVYPRGSTTKMILQYGIPIPNPLNLTLGFGSGFQYQYQEVQNSTLLTRYYPFMTARRKRDLSISPVSKERELFYKALEISMNRLGLDGRNCLLRTICEAAESPVDENGLVGEILHIVLTPNYGDEDLSGSSEKTENDYFLAYKAGMAGEDCRDLYYQCPQGEGLFDMISRLEDP